MSERKQEEIARLRKLPPPTDKAIIGGALSDAASGRTRQVVSPIDGAAFAEIPECDAEDVDRAVTLARKSFADRRWRGMTPKERKRILLRLVTLIEADAPRLAVLETPDMGIPVRMAEELDIGFAIDTLRWYAEACDKLYDEMATLEHNVTASDHARAVGRHRRNLALERAGHGRLLENRPSADHRQFGHRQTGRGRFPRVVENWRAGAGGGNSGGCAAGRHRRRRRGRSAGRPSRRRLHRIYRLR